MYDNKTDPKVVTLVSECEICGATKEAVFRAANDECKHQWATLRRVNVMATEDAKIPSYSCYEQQCGKCGELRRVNLSKGKE